MKLFRFIFYRIYMQQLRWFGEKELPHFTAIISISALVYFNILSLMTILFAINNQNFGEIISDNTIIVSMLILLGLFYLIFLHNQRYKQIIKEFSKEKNTKKMIIYTYVYIIGTIIGFIGSIILASYLLN